MLWIEFDWSVVVLKLNDWVILSDVMYKIKNLFCFYLKYISLVWNIEFVSSCGIYYFVEVVLLYLLVD